MSMSATLARLTNVWRKATGSIASGSASSKTGRISTEITQTRNSSSFSYVYQQEKVSDARNRTTQPRFATVVKTPGAWRRKIEKENNLLVVTQRNNTEKQYAIPPAPLVSQSSSAERDPDNTTDATQLSSGTDSAYESHDEPDIGTARPLRSQASSRRHTIGTATIRRNGKPKPNVPLRLQPGTLVETMIDTAIKKKKLDASQRYPAINVVRIAMNQLQNLDDSAQKAAICGHIATCLARTVDHCCQQHKNVLKIKLLQEEGIKALTDSISTEALDKNGWLYFFSSSTSTPVSKHNSDPLAGIIQTATGIQAPRFINKEEFIACCTNIVMCSLLSAFIKESPLSLSETVNKIVHEVKDSMNAELILHMNQWIISPETDV